MSERTIHLGTTVPVVPVTEIAEAVALITATNSVSWSRSRPAPTSASLATM